jgi:hypothetical protein
MAARSMAADALASSYALRRSPQQNANSLGSAEASTREQPFSRGRVATPQSVDLTNSQRGPDEPSERCGSCTAGAGRCAGGFSPGSCDPVFDSRTGFDSRISHAPRTQGIRSGSMAHHVARDLSERRFSNVRSASAASPRRFCARCCSPDQAGNEPAAGRIVNDRRVWRVN